MSENLKKKTSLWLLSFKIQTYLKGKPFSKEESLTTTSKLKDKLVLPIRPKVTNSYEEIKEKYITVVEEKQPPLSWLEIPPYIKSPQGLIDVLIFSGKLEKEHSLSKKTLTREEEESLNKWMKAIEIENYAVKRFPWSENNLSLKYPQIESWFYQTIKEINPKIILILGEENISLITGYPVLLEFIHGIEFPFSLKDISIPLLASYSPKDLSFNSGIKRHIWSDLKRLKGLLLNL